MVVTTVIWHRNSMSVRKTLSPLQRLKLDYCLQTIAEAENECLTNMNLN